MNIQTHSGPCRLCGKNTHARYDRDGYQIAPTVRPQRGDFYLCGRCRRAYEVNWGEAICETYGYGAGAVTRRDLLHRDG